MEYRYCINTNYEDLSSGRVIYGSAGIPNFPVRLGNEIFRRCLEYTDCSTNLIVYDPCCGGGYLLTILGFCNSDIITEIIGSDISEKMIAHAKRNTSLLTKQGLYIRKNELLSIRDLYHKQSHEEALDSLARLEKKLTRDIDCHIFKADCFMEIEKSFSPDIIITDVPYGNLVNWSKNTANPIEVMMEQLAKISHRGTVLAIIMDKKAKAISSLWKRVEKQLVGKRKFEIFVFENEF